MVPDSPAEPDPEPYDMVPPKIIPLDDVRHRKTVSRGLPLQPLILPLIKQKVVSCSHHDPLSPKTCHFRVNQCLILWSLSYLFTGRDRTLVTVHALVSYLCPALLRFVLFPIFHFVAVASGTSTSIEKIVSHSIFEMSRERARSRSVRSQRRIFFITCNDSRCVRDMATRMDEKQGFLSLS